MVVNVVSICQLNGILRAADADLTSVVVWSQIHGLISLYLEGQISHTILDNYELRKILLYALNQFTLVPIQ